MNAVQIVSSSWFLPAYLGALAGTALGMAGCLTMQWFVRRADR